MKIICVLLAAICAMLHSISYNMKTKTVDEMVASRAQVISSEPVENEFKYEIETPDGNVWVIYGDSDLNAETKMVVVFYTFESEDVECWDVIEYWITERA